MTPSSSPEWLHERATSNEMIDAGSPPAAPAPEGSGHVKPSSPDSRNVMSPPGAFSSITRKRPCATISRSAVLKVTVAFGSRVTSETPLRLTTKFAQ